MAVVVDPDMCALIKEVICAKKDQLLNSDALKYIAIGVNRQSCHSKVITHYKVIVAQQE